MFFAVDIVFLKIRKSNKCYSKKIKKDSKASVNKTSAPKESIICCYLYFLEKGFRFHLIVCNHCNHVLIMSNDVKNIAILNTNGVDYRCNIFGISKIEVRHLLKTGDLSEKSGSL